MAKAISRAGHSYANPLVLALPRGGVPVAREVAAELATELDVIVVRKLGTPKNHEYGFGAIAETGEVFLNENVISAERISPKEVTDITQSEQRELDRRSKLYRHGKPLPNLRGRTVIVVDDGIATGSTLKVALLALRKLGPQSLIAAVPVAPPGAQAEFLKYADEFICPLYTNHLGGVGAWYENFDQVNDDEVIAALG